MKIDSPSATRRAVLVLALVAGCHTHRETCEQARDHLIDLRFAAAGHEPKALWQLLVDHGGADNVDHKALVDSAALPHDEAWFASLRNRQRYSMTMRKWVSACVDDMSKDHAACLAAAPTLDDAARCD